MDDKQNHKSAIELSWVPSNIAIRPYLIIGNKVNKMADVIILAIGSLGFKFHWIKPPNGTTKVEKSAGKNLIQNSEGNKSKLFWKSLLIPIAKDIIQCKPGGLLRYGLSQIVGNNLSIPLFWFNSKATLATVASSKSLKGKFPRETNAIPQAMAQKRKTHKMGGL